MIKNSEKQIDNGIFERAKQRDILEVARNLEIELNKQPNGDYRCTSIKSPDDNPTCVCISPDKGLWHDFKAEANKDNISGGTVIELVMLVNNCSAIESAKYLTGEDGKNSEYYNKRFEQLKNLNAMYNKAHEALKNDAETLDYLHSRRISDEFIEQFCLGVRDEWRAEDCDENGTKIEDVYEKRLQVPYFDKFGRMIYGVSRCLPNHEYIDIKTGKATKYKKLWLDEKGKWSALYQPLMGLNTLKYVSNELIIGEGVFDFASFAQEKYSSLFFVGGSAGKQNEPELIEECKKFNRIVLCFDSDTSGENFTYKIGKLLFDNGILFDVVRDYGEGVKDVSDYYANGGDLRKLIDGAKSGYIFMAEKFCKDYPLRKVSFNAREANKKKLTDFINKLKNIEEFEPELVAEVKRILISSYGEKAVKSSEKTDKKSEQELIREYALEIISETKIFSRGSLKHQEFYMYDIKRGMWRRKKDSEMMNFTYKKNGIYEKTARKIKDEIHMMTKQDDDEKLKFNLYEGFNLKNGVFNIITGELETATPEMMFSTQLDVSYDKSAKCPKFEKFLEDFSNGSKTRLKTIRNMLGYIFGINTGEQVFFVLLGTGGNGKGVFQKIMSAILGGSHENFVTSIAPDEMHMMNKLITLQNSLLNFCPDCNPRVDMKQCTAIKAATGGDEISGNYKFFDILSFRTRAKFIFGFNEMPKFADHSLGMKRRAIFIKLQKNFIGHEIFNLEEDILKDEKAGIFNYLYECYLELMQQGGRIARCEDQEAMMKDFEIESNIIAQWWDEKQADYRTTTAEKTNKDVYTDFKVWCKDMNVRDMFMSQRQFTKRFKEFLPELKVKDSNGRRIYRFNLLFGIGKETEEQKKNQKTEPQQEIQFEAPEAPERTEENVKAFFNRERHPEMPFEAKKKAEEKGEPFKPVEDTLEHLEECIRKPINAGEIQKNLIAVRDKFKELFNVA